MILTVNIGNTHITVGGYEQDTLIFCGRLHSDPAATVEEYAIRLVNLLQLYEASPAQIEGGILGSVVPILSGRVLAALQLLCKARILTVGPGLKSGIKLRLDNPAQLGAELLCGAVAALAECPGPLVVISADTAISLMAVNAKQELVGGVILPGPQLSMNALVQKTAQLPQIDPAARASDSVLGKSTSACLQNGFVLGTASLLDGLADRFCADLMKALTGHGDFFLSTLAFVKNSGKNKRDVWITKPTGRNLRKITDIPGIAMSPSWSLDGRFIVFSHMDDKSHALGVWDRLTNRVQRIRFPGNTVIGPTFTPGNKVAVSLSTGKNPDIFMLNHAFQKERTLEANGTINVSPTFDAAGTKMAFTSNRMGGPQIFMKDLASGSVSRVTKQGNYNTEPSMSPDGTLIAFSRLTSEGNRIFVQDLTTGTEQQISFGPGNDVLPSFAPDSYFIAFTSNRSGPNQIYLTTRHGGDAKKVPTGSGDASFPRWGAIPR